MTFTIIGFLMMTGNPQPIDVIEHKAETLELCMSGVQALLDLPVKAPQSVQAYCAVRIAGEKT
jgi:hypothetical protein